MLTRRSFLQGLGLLALWPFVRFETERKPIKSVRLLEDYIAGFQYHEGMKLEILSTLDARDELVLVREPQNRYDENAIKITTRTGHKLGYIPRGEAEFLAPLMDQSVQTQTQIVEIGLDAKPWERVLVEVRQIL